MTTDATNAPAGPSSGITAAWALWIAQILLALVLFILMFLSQLSIASCTETSCDYAAYSAIITFFNVGVLVLLVSALAGIVLLRRRASVAIWIPVIGMALTVVLVVVAYPLSREALDLPLFGNRL